MNTPLCCHTLNQRFLSSYCRSITLPSRRNVLSAVEGTMSELRLWPQTEQGEEEEEEEGM